MTEAGGLLHGSWSSGAVVAFQARYEALAEPFEWKFTRPRPRELLERLTLNGTDPLPEAG